MKHKEQSVIYSLPTYTLTLIASQSSTSPCRRDPYIQRLIHPLHRRAQPAYAPPKTYLQDSTFRKTLTSDFHI